MLMDRSLLRSAREWCVVRGLSSREEGTEVGQTLDKGYGADNEDGHCDGRRVVPLPQTEREEGRSQQEQYQRFLELTEELHPCRVGLAAARV